MDFSMSSGALNGYGILRAFESSARFFDSGFFA